MINIIDDDVTFNSTCNEEEYENNISNNANDIGDDDNLSTDQANSIEEDSSQEKGMLCVRI